MLSRRVNAISNSKWRNCETAGCSLTFLLPPRLGASCSAILQFLRFTALPPLYSSPPRLNYNSDTSNERKCIFNSVIVIVEGWMLPLHITFRSNEKLKPLHGFTKFKPPRVCRKCRRTTHRICLKQKQKPLYGFYSNKKPPIACRKSSRSRFMSD